MLFMTCNGFALVCHFLYMIWSGVPSTGGGTMNAISFSIVRFPGYLATPRILLQGNPATSPDPERPSCYARIPPQGQIRPKGIWGISLAPGESSSRPATDPHHKSPQPHKKTKKRDKRKRQTKETQKTDAYDEFFGMVC